MGCGPRGKHLHRFLRIRSENEAIASVGRIVTAMRNASVLRILIASPADVSQERQAAQRVISQWNASNSMARGVVLESVLWESHSYPAAGSPQEVLNQQIVDDCDIVVGIFWTRLGTPTATAASGTVEEIE